jgi:serine/threonine protein phosphatase PrpC
MALFVDEHYSFLSDIKNNRSHQLFHRDKICSRTDINNGSSGLNGPENQDSYKIDIIYKNGEKFNIFIMADGHGRNGGLMSSEIVNKISIIVITRFDEIMSNPPLLQDIIENFNEELSKNFSHNITGGSTVTLVIEGDGIKICANISDCEAITFIDTDPSNILMFRDGIQLKNESQIITLTEDHSADSLSEVERVINIGAKVHFDSSNGSFCKEAYYQEIKDGVTTYKAHPYTIQSGSYKNNVNGDVAKYVKHGRFQFNMTAALGDFGCIFLKHRPTLTIITFPKGTQTKLIIGSDGYFNCFTTIEVTEQLYLDIDTICTNAYEKVDKTFGYDNADNMTIIASSYL